MAKSELKNEPTVNPLTESAKEAWRTSDSTDQAVEKFKRLVRKQGLQQSLLAWAEHDYIRQFKHEGRQGPYTSPRPDNPSGLNALADMEERHIFEQWRLNDGTRLGDAVKEQIAADIGYYQRLSENHLKKSRFLERIVTAIGNKPVREALSESKVTQWYAEMLT